jgi:ATP-binding cassette, subfamily C, bacteriocin exporter
MKKSILVKQRDKSDCGAACLVSVAAYFGLHIPVSRVRLHAGTNRQGTNLRSLIAAAEQLGFQVKGAKKRGIMLTSLPVPTVFHMVFENGLQHFVVAYKITKEKISFMDPAIGEIVTCSISEFENNWSGVILLIAPSVSFRGADKKESVYPRFWLLIKPHRNLLMLALGGAGIYTVLGLSTSIYVQKIFDLGLQNKNMPLISLMSVTMIIVFIFRMLVGYLKSLLVLKSGQQIDNCLILGYYKHLLNLPQLFFDSMRVGEILSRVNDAVRIRIFINDVAVNVVLNLLSVALCLAVMFLYYWKMALAILCSIPVYLLIYEVSNRVNKKWQRKIMETSAVLESHLVETVQGITTIRRFGAATWFNLKTENRLVLMKRAVFESARNGLLLGHLSEAVTGVITIGILWAGSSWVIDHRLSPGELMSFYTLTAFFTLPIQALIGINRSVQDALIAADRLFEILDLETEQTKGSGIEEFPEGDIEFKGVDFSYSPSFPVFTGLQLLFPQKSITGVMGETGSGKSTLISLIQKFYIPNAGNIQIGNQDIRDISTDLIRRKISAVPQHTDIFQGDFISNIALGDSQPDLQMVFDICRRLGLDEAIDRLPDRYQTVIQEQGINLSGGQKQKIGIARALYSNPTILFLDEATSALDPESEQKVLDTLLWFLGLKKTIIMIAHRKSSLKCCDGLIYIKQGKAEFFEKNPLRLRESQGYADWWANYE